MTKISIPYTDRHTDERTHGRTDKLIPVYPRKHSFCGGIKNSVKTMAIDPLRDFGLHENRQKKPWDVFTKYSQDNSLSFQDFVFLKVNTSDQLSQ